MRRAFSPARESAILCKKQAENRRIVARTSRRRLTRGLYVAELSDVGALHVPNVLPRGVVIRDPGAQHLAVPEHVVRRGEGR